MKRLRTEDELCHIFMKAKREDENLGSGKKIPSQTFFGRFRFDLREEILPGAVCQRQEPNGATILSKRNATACVTKRYMNIHQLLPMTEATREQPASNYLTL